MSLTKQKIFDPVVVRPDESKVVHAFGDELIFHLTGEMTGGQTALCTNITPPAGGPPPHYHLNEDETFWVLEGEAEFLLNGVWQVMPIGTVVHVPRGLVHTFRNVGQTPLKLMIQTSPAGFDQFMVECAAEFAQEGPPDMQKIVEISANYGIHYVE